ncbi:SusD/RagB family nutrient-binding outer membrane lipoprotein [Pedobacter mucosus]|uniref:SusD/RagB family nutrient-binding outer membrane lipoprotein n=1 Tax=Pedobacter mucosus TaxID=2895286 RepID=UPI001EE4E135|nr:SusD/RagB family nutrient-binding outer membrane lipoprotein [Pedobacter mucosus]UKT64685.1 SusD/RagB family nutrient-binding outer membrane lipoprotein [Pedobacter mucosus]
MKYIHTTLLVFAVISSIFFTGCKKLFDQPDINNNPNAVTNIDLPTLFSGTLLGVSLLHEDTDVRIASMWSGQLSGLNRAHLGYAQYIVSSQNFSWNTIYSVAGQARLIQFKADSVGNKWGKGLGQILEVLAIQKVTDLYGDVPYSQAFDGKLYPTPVFDSQQNVYKALLNVLDDAIKNLSATSGSAFPTKDFIYKGDISKWKAAANTLKARLNLHLGNYAAAIESSKLGINSTGDALVPHGNSIGVDMNQNYDFFAVSRTGDTGFDGAYLPVLLRSRINSSNSKTDETAIFNYFFKTGITATNSLDPNTVDGAFVSSASHPILTYYENQLILAEAQARQGLLDDAIISLNSVRSRLASGTFNGRTLPTAGRKYEAYNLADFSRTGLANPTQSSNVQYALLYEIIAQRYIVLLMQYEVFNDYRRLAVALPVVELPIPLKVGSKKPQRFIYPQTEINTNPNVPKPLPDQFTKTAIYN